MRQGFMSLCYLVDRNRPFHRDPKSASPIHASTLHLLIECHLCVLATTCLVRDTSVPVVSVTAVHLQVVWGISTYLLSWSLAHCNQFRRGIEFCRDSVKFQCCNLMIDYLMQCAVKAKSPKQLRQGFMSLRYQVDWNYSPLHRYTKSAYPSMPADTSEPVVSATAVHLSVRQSLLMTLQWFYLHSERMDVVGGRFSNAENYVHLTQTYVCIWCPSLTRTESFLGN